MWQKQFEGRLAHSVKVQLTEGKAQEQLCDMAACTVPTVRKQVNVSTELTSSRLPSTQDAVL